MDLCGPSQWSGLPSIKLGDWGTKGVREVHTSYAARHISTVLQLDPYGAVRVDGEINIFFDPLGLR